jgi:hypothetical protein
MDTFGPLDIRLKVSKAFPAANGNNQSDGLPAGGGDIFARRDGRLFLDIPANEILADGLAITAKVQHSSDDGNLDAYADVACLGAVAVTGRTGDGTPEATVPGAFEVLPTGAIRISWPCPVNLKRWTRAHVAVANNAGNLTGLNYTFGYAVHA